MKQHFRISIAVLLVGLLLVAPLYAKLSSRQKRTAEASLKQLSSRNSAVRREAVKKLVALQDKVLAMVRKTLAETKNKEVKLGCILVLERITGDSEVPIDYPDEKELNYSTSRVTIDMTKVTLQEVFDMLAQQGGNRRVNVHRNASDRIVTFTVKNMPYWQAINKLCQSHKLVYNTNRRNRRNADSVSPVEKVARETIVFSGAMSLKMRRIGRSYSRSARLRFDARRKSGEPVVVEKRSLGLTVTYRIEDRLPILNSLSKITRVASADGVNHAIVSKEKDKFRGGRNRSPSGSMPAQLDEPAGGLKGALTVEGYVTFGFGVGKKELRLENVFGKDTPAVRNDEGMSMNLVTVSHEKDGDTSVIFEVTHGASDKESMWQPQPGARYGLALMDPKGKRYWHPTTMNMSGRGKEIRVTLNFRTLPDIDGEWAIVYTAPVRIVKKTFPFKFENVPLP